MTHVAWRETVLSPKDEDRSLFSNAPSQRKVFLVPANHQTAEDARVIEGFLPGNVAVEVVFAGRRRTLADPLIERLDKLLAQIGDDPDTPRDTVRLPVAVYGSLRSRFVQDADGWQTKRFQLIAAMWRLREPSGRLITRGSPPITQHRRHLRPL